MGKKEREQDGGKGLAPIEMMKSRRPGAYGSGAQRRRNDGGARPRNVETTGARVSFRPRNIFPHFCMLFLKLLLFVVMLPT